MPQHGPKLCHIGSLCSQFTELWWKSECQSLPELPTHSEHDQALREAELEQFLDIAIAEMRQSAQCASDLQPAEERMLAAAERLLCPALDLDRRHLALMAGSGFRRNAVEFIQKARQFDPLLAEEDLLQASRNAWTMYNLQLVLGLPMRLTSAVLGYSLIYPYSDNLLDDPGIDTRTKAAFSERLARRLSGERLPPVHAPEQRIWQLVCMIEEQYARSLFPAVYDSLLAIQSAQTRSVDLLEKDASPYEVDVLRMALEKGGASVLADGFLVAGSLTHAQQVCLFGLGALLQLVDDLQDVDRNRKQGLLTIYSQTAQHWPLDRLTNRTFHFARQILEQFAHIGMPDTAPLKELMQRSVVLLLLEAAQRARSYHTRRYIQELERFSPVRFSFLPRTRDRVARLRRLLTAWLGATPSQENRSPAPRRTVMAAWLRRGHSAQGNG